MCVCVCVCLFYFYLSWYTNATKNTHHTSSFTFCGRRRISAIFFILHFHLYNRHLVQFHGGYSNIRVFYTLTINVLCLYIHIKLMRERERIHFTHYILTFLHFPHHHCVNVKNIYISHFQMLHHCLL